MVAGRIVCRCWKGTVIKLNISLEYYRIFYHVVKEGSITAAANTLCVSQPAVSQTIRQLEAALGVTLFLRAQKGIRLTVEGQTLFQYVERGYETILQGEHALQSMLELEQGEIHIGASDMTLKYYLLPYLERFHERYPGVKVNVTNGPTPETLKHLKDGRIDFCVVSGPVEEDEGIIVRPVKQIRDVFIAGSRFQHLKGKKLSWNILQELPVICLEKGTSSRNYVDSFLRENKVELQPEFELATSDMIVQFVLRNLGIGAVVAPFATPFIASGEVFELEFETKIPPRAFLVATDSKMPLSKAGKSLLELLQDEF